MTTSSLYLMVITYRSKWAWSQSRVLLIKYFGPIRIFGMAEACITN